MEKFVERTLLYDFYGELLTEHQQSIYEDVVLNDYSCTEVAAERGISRQGVHDMIRRCDKILSDEDKETIAAVLREDPRPSYQDGKDRIYGMMYKRYDVRFYVEGKCIHVIEIPKL